MRSETAGFKESIVGYPFSPKGKVTTLKPAAAAVAGLLMQNTGRSRMLVLIIYVVGAIAWPLIPAISSIGAYVYAKGAYWPMHATALLGLWASPWAVKQIRTYATCPTARHQHL